MCPHNSFKGGLRAHIADEQIANVIHIDFYATIKTQHVNGFEQSLINTRVQERQ